MGPRLTLRLCLSGLVLVACLARAVGTQAEAKAQRYTAQEAAILRALDASAGLPQDDRLHALHTLASQDAFADALGQGLVALQQCDLAARTGLDSRPYAQRLRQLHARNADQELVMAVLSDQCQMLVDQYAGRTRGFDQAWRHYHQSQQAGLPGLHYEVASSYAHLAQSLGLLDEALKAIGQALSIAEANQDTPYIRNSLMDLALVQADMGLHEDALRNSGQALALEGPSNRIAHLSNRGYILTRAGRLDEAASVYDGVLRLSRAEPDRQASQLSALINLANIYNQRGLSSANLQVTAEAMELIGVVDSSVDKGFARSARAIALAAVGRIAEAQPLFEQGSSELATGSEHGALVEYTQAWATHLAGQQQWELAYQAMRRARELAQTSDNAERKRRAQYLSATLESSRKDMAIESLRLQNEVAAAQAARRRAAELAGAVALGSLGLLLAVVLWAYLGLRRSNARLYHENAHDPLTQLHNRPFFNRHFQAHLGQIHAAKAMLALLDIDHFKQINDQHGHATGDEVLRQVSTRLKSALRSGDVIARWGGEEFLVFIKDLGPELHAHEMAERLRTVLAREPLHVGAHTLPVTVSIGYAELELGPQTRLDQELERIDARLYAAKAAGRNRSVGNDPSQIVPELGPVGFT
jgi:diguanylate cyclase (GGDEF)-like protein